jgi:hypothetical protein
MKSARVGLSIVATAVLALALAGCGGSGGPGSGSGASGGLAGCLAGKTWNLDVDDMASQLGDELGAKGADVASSVAEGTETITFARSGHTTSTNDVTYTITENLESGLTMSLAQKHTGDASGDWVLRGHSIHFEHWTSGTYKVENHLMVGGVESSAPVVIPDAGAGGVTMAVTCHGNALTTKVAISPFTQHWSAG